MRKFRPIILASLLIMPMLIWGPKSLSQITVSPLVAPRKQFFDASGRPLAGGHICTYTVGSSTPQVTFTDYTGATPNGICDPLTDPLHSDGIILDAGGYASIYVNCTLSPLKVVAYDQNLVLQWSEDGVAYPTCIQPQACPAGQFVTGWNGLGEPICAAASAGSACTDLSQQTHYYVSPTGSDSTGLGTLASPWRQIQYAINQIPGVVCGAYYIHLAQGEYCARDYDYGGGGNYCVGAPTQTLDVNIHIDGRVFAGGGAAQVSSASAPGGFNGEGTYYPWNTFDDPTQGSHITIVGTQDPSASDETDNPDLYIVDLGAPCGGNSVISMAGARVELRGFSIRHGGYGVVATHSQLKLSGITLEGNCAGIATSDNTTVIMNKDDGSYYCGIDFCDYAQFRGGEYLCAGPTPCDVPTQWSLILGDGSYMTDENPAMGDNTDGGLLDVMMMEGTTPPATCSRGGEMMFQGMARVQFNGGVNFDDGHYGDNPAACSSLAQNGLRVNYGSSARIDTLQITPGAGNDSGGIHLEDRAHLKVNTLVMNGETAFAGNSAIFIDDDSTFSVPPYDGATGWSFADKIAVSAGGGVGQPLNLRAADTPLIASSFIDDIPYSATPEINIRHGGSKRMLLTGNVTSSTTTSGSAFEGSEITLILCQDAGDNSFVFPTNFVGAQDIWADDCTTQRFQYESGKAYNISYPTPGYWRSIAPIETSGQASTGSIGSSSSAAVTVTLGRSLLTTPIANPSVTCEVIQNTASLNTLRVHHIESVVGNLVTVRVANDDAGGAHTGTVSCIAKPGSLNASGGLWISDPAQLPDATIGVPYSYTFHPTGGTPAYNWSGDTSTMATGITFNPATGVLSGTPTATTNCVGPYCECVITLGDTTPFTVSRGFQMTVNP